jgi:hypothetical protein
MNELGSVNNSSIFHVVNITSTQVQAEVYPNLNLMRGLRVAFVLDTYTPTFVQITRKKRDTYRSISLA